MSDTAMTGRPPLVLIASNQEWSSRSLETILAPNGYAVLRAYTGASALERARGVQPDVIIVDSLLPDYDGLDVCRQLRSDPQIPASTPILVISAEPPTRQRRIEALRAGAWDHFTQPLDSEEFLLRVETIARAKRDADQAREESLVDRATGLYNMRGLTRRARELGSQAYRKRSALACVVFAPDFEAPDREPASGDRPAAAILLMAGALKGAGRMSDAIGRLGPSEFAVVAIGTDADGCLKAAERLAHAMDSVPDRRSAWPFALRAGYCAVPDFHSASLDAVETILRATAALRTARVNPEGGWLRGFEDRTGNGAPAH